MLLLSLPLFSLLLQGCVNVEKVLRRARLASAIRGQEYEIATARMWASCRVCAHPTPRPRPDHVRRPCRARRKEGTENDRKQLVDCGNALKSHSMPRCQKPSTDNVRRLRKRPLPSRSRQHGQKNSAPRGSTQWDPRPRPSAFVYVLLLLQQGFRMEAGRKATVPCAVFHLRFSSAYKSAPLEHV